MSANQLSNLNISVDSIKKLANEQSGIQVKIADAKQECGELKNMMATLLEAAVSAAAASPSEASPNTEKSITESVSSSCVTTVVDDAITVVSSSPAIPSNSDAITAGPSVPLVPTINNDVEIPLLQNFLKCAADGKIDLTDDFCQQLYNINTRIDEVNSVVNDLQQKWSELDSSLRNIIEDIENIKQYLMKESLLLHDFPLPPSNSNSLQYSMFVADKINEYLPQLPVTVDWRHISTAHFLPTKAKKSKVIIVRFANRCVKDMVYEHRHFLPPKMGITEHMTEHFRGIINKARELFGYHSVQTRDCKIVVDLYGRDHTVTSMYSVNKLFVWYCEFLGKSDAVPYSAPKRTPNVHLPVASPSSYAGAVKHNATDNKFRSRSFYRSNR